MAVNYNEKIDKAILGAKDKFKDEDYQLLQDVIENIYDEAALQDVADSLALQYLSDNYYNVIKGTDLGNLVLDALQKGKINTAPEPLRKTEELLGNEQPKLMPTKLDSKLLAEALGTKAEDLLNWSSPKHWSKFNVGKMKDALSKAGIDFNTAISSLSNLQETQDRSNVVEGYDPVTGKAKLLDYATSAAAGLLAPRTKEAIAMGKSPSGKDVALDITGDVLEAMPFGRAAGLVMKGAKVAPRAFVTTLAGNASVPFTEGVLDAAAYDDNTNADRARFKPGTVLQQSIVNAAAPKVIGGTITSLGSGLLGERGIGRAAERLMRGDPYLEALDKRVNFNIRDPYKRISGKDYQDALNTEIMDYMLPILDNKKLRKKISDESLDEYKKALDMPYGKSTKEARDAIEAANASKYTPDYSKKFFEGFENVEPGYVSPTTMLNRSKLHYNNEEVNPAEIFGITESGNLAVKAPKADVEAVKKLNKNHGYPEIKTEKSINDYFRDLSNEIERTPEADKLYPMSARPTKADKVIESFYNNPGFMAGVRARHPGYKLGEQMGITFATNKAGRSDMADRFFSELKKNEVDEATALPAEVRKELDDPINRRLWDSKFIPKEIEGDPLWEAYKVYEENKKKSKKGYKPAGPLTLDDALKVR